MKEVTINGVTYISVVTAAKEFKYTTDYIGQLCRAKKIDAQLVGRSWYINPLSLNSLRNGKYSRNKKVVTSNVSEEVRTDDSEAGLRVAVEPVVKKTTTKMAGFILNSGYQQNFAKRIDWKPVRYESDNSELLPAITNKKQVNLDIDLADSTEIAIKSATKSMKFETSELPTVSLRGKVLVESLEEDYIYDDYNDKIKDLDFDAVLPQAISPSVLITGVVGIDNKQSKQPKQAEVAQVIKVDWFELVLYTTTACLLLALVSSIFVESSLNFSDSGVTYEYQFKVNSLMALLPFFN